MQPSPRVSLPTPALLKETHWCRSVRTAGNVLSGGKTTYWNQAPKPEPTAGELVELNKGW